MTRKGLRSVCGFPSFLVKFLRVQLCVLSLMELLLNITQIQTSSSSPPIILPITLPTNLSNSPFEVEESPTKQAINPYPRSNPFNLTVFKTRCFKLCSRFSELYVAASSFWVHFFRSVLFQQQKSFLNNVPRTKAKTNVTFQTSNIYVKLVTKQCNYSLSLIW